jgi:hypothetical protein
MEITTMRKIAFTLAAGLLALGVAGITMAASPAPSGAPKASQSPSPSPAASTSPAASPSTSSGGTSSSAGTGATTPGATTWSAAIAPLNVTTGKATVVQNSNGTGTITVTLNGLRPDAAWSVDIDAGTIKGAREATSAEIASRASMGVEKVSSDTFRVHLTAAEMKAFLAARKGTGVVVLVSDGTNRSAATFTGA